MSDLQNGVGDDERIPEIENDLLQGLFGCRSEEAVEAAVTYAAFLSSVGLTPDNFPVFVKMLEIENHYVIDALIGQRDPFLLLSAVQPDSQLIGRLFSMLSRWPRGQIYHKNLLAILGVLQAAYSTPAQGYDLYPPRIRDLNVLGKHLDREAGQDDSVNRIILEILAKLAELEDTSDAQKEGIAAHAAAIRDTFLDEKKRLEDVIPPVLLARIEPRGEVPPRKLAPPVERTGKPVAVVMVDEAKPKPAAPKPAAPKPEPQS